MRSVLHRNVSGLLTLVAWASVACGGAPPAGGGAQTASSGGDTQAVPIDDTTTAQAEQVELLREVFTYRGTGRDPFRSLVESGPELRPFLEDLRVMSIIYDARYPARSVAVLRDTTLQVRYQLRVDDEFGRLRVTEIRQQEVVITIEDFGVPRQVVLSVRRRQGGNK